MWLFRRRRRWRPELCRHHKNLVSFGIERHGASAFPGRHILRNAELIWGIFPHDDQDSFAARRKCQISFRIKGCRVHSFTNRHRGDELAAVGIHDSHHFVVARGKQSPIFAIESQSTRLRAGSQGPARLHCQLVGIKREQLAFVFQIDKNFTLAVADGELRLPIQLDGADDCAFGGVNGSGIITMAVESEDTVRRRIEKDGVRVVANFDLAQRFQ